MSFKPLGLLIKSTQQVNKKFNDFWLVRAVYFAVFATFATIYFYSSHFEGYPLSDVPSDWGAFGDYIAGILNPFFGFITVIAVVRSLTNQSAQLKISSDQLKLSSDELQLTRIELEKSSNAQIASEKALKLQDEIANKSSELNTINFLLAKYKEDLRLYDYYSVPGSQEDINKKELLRKQSILESKVEDIYKLLTKLGD